MIPLNQQKPEKPHVRESGVLAVHDIWPTIQGEGPLAGWPAIFVRLAGCNLQCPACDTDYTSKRIDMTPKEVLKAVRKASTWREISDDTTGSTDRRLVTDLVVITGGEPYRQNFFPAARMLMESGYTVQVETNGTLGNPEEGGLIPLIVVCSPKMPNVHEDIRESVKVYKYVMRHDQVDPLDGLPCVALGGARPFRPRGWGARHDGPYIMLQPEDDQDEEINKKNMAACVESCQRHGYRLGQQLHKVIGVK